MTLDDAIKRLVTEALDEVLAPIRARLADPEPLAWTVAQTARALSTSEPTIRRLIREGVLPTVPHMGARVLIPRWAVEELVRGERPAEGLRAVS